VPALVLRAEPKWTRFPNAGVRNTHEGSTLADFFSIKRGLATGDNSFFIMSKDQIAERDLPMNFFKPILPAPRHLPTNLVEADADGIPLIDKQLFILDCRQGEEEIRTGYPTLWRYLQTGKENVGSRYLCRSRSPWYAQEERPAPPFVCTYMGRGNEKRTHLFRFIWNRSRATAANVYLLLYPKPALAEALLTQPALYERVWEYLKGIDQMALIGEGRVYGGGLYKMEPKELGRVPAERLVHLCPERPTKPLQHSLLSCLD
jgi:hypothetical protein